MTKLRTVWAALSPLLICLASPQTHALEVTPTAAALPVAKFVEIPASKDQLKQLRNGGFTLYMRHGFTDNTKVDRTPAVDLDDCTTQRPLTEQGKKLATMVGEKVRQAKIPISEIRSSPLCRAKETTEAAFGKNSYTLDNQLMYPGNLMEAQKLPIISNTRHLLSTPVAAGKNRLIVAHAPNLMELIGYFPKEGTIVIFRPLGDEKFDYVASIPPALWSELLP